jgi:ATP-binding protein involved in chromosome partitioning
VKAQIKSGAYSLNQVFELSKSDEAVAKMRVFELLESISGVGKVRARSVMERLNISPTRRIQGLGAKQLPALLAEFASPTLTERGKLLVLSGPGGVGKSTVAVNLATSLALEGAKVGLMDADVYGPNIPTMMGLTEGPEIRKDAERGEVFLPPSAHGVKVMSMGFLVPGDQPAIWRGPMLHSVVSQFCHKVDWGTLDYLVVDMPPGTGDVQLSLAQLVPVTGAVLVSTPQEVSMQDVRKAYHMFEKVRVPLIGFVENMSYFKCDGCDKKHYPFGQDGGKLLARRFNGELLAQLPMNPGVREAGDDGRPAVISCPDSETAIAMRDLARKVAQRVSILAENLAIDPSQIVQIGKF